VFLIHKPWFIFCVKKHVMNMQRKQNGVIPSLQCANMLIWIKGDGEHI
jgi:hypothetical protein